MGHTQTTQEGRRPKQHNEEEQHRRCSLQTFCQCQLEEQTFILVREICEIVRVAAATTTATTTTTATAIATTTAPIRRGRHVRCYGLRSRSTVVVLIVRSCCGAAPLPSPHTPSHAPHTRVQVLLHGHPERLRKRIIDAPNVHRRPRPTWRRHDITLVAANATTPRPRHLRIALAPPCATAAALVGCPRPRPLTAAPIATRAVCRETRKQSLLFIFILRPPFPVPLPTPPHTSVRHASSPHATIHMSLLLWSALSLMLSSNLPLLLLLLLLLLWSLLLRTITRQRPRRKEDPSADPPRPVQQQRRASSNHRRRRRRRRRRRCCYTAAASCFTIIIQLATTTAVSVYSCGLWLSPCLALACAPFARRTAVAHRAHGINAVGANDATGGGGRGSMLWEKAGKVGLGRGSTLKR